MIMIIQQVRERENGPGERACGERIELSNQREGSRGLPTAAHWPGLRARERARYRIIAETCRYDTTGAAPRATTTTATAAANLSPVHLRSIDRSRARDYPSDDRGDDANAQACARARSERDYSLNERAKHARPASL